MIKKIFILILMLLLLCTDIYAQTVIGLELNGEPISSEQAPLIINGRTLAPLRAVCEALKLGVSWDKETETIKISDEFNLVILTINSTTIDVNGELCTLEAPPQIYNGHTVVPIRAIAEAFGAKVLWNSNNNSIDITLKTLLSTDSAEILAGVSTAAHQQTEEVEEKINIPENADNIDFNPDGFSFYSQPDSEWGFENNGRGYCWVCSYAMIITNITNERITPAEIAQFNLENGGESGSYMTSHTALASKYGLTFTKALNSDSVYFDSFETQKRGATYIKAETDDEVRAALCEALTIHKDGVMVRFEGYPHTLVATRYENGIVYFNDPAGENNEDTDFSGTCLAKSFTLSDISFIQALVLK